MNSEYWKKALEFEDIIFEKSEEGIAKITINRPEVRNAFRPLTVKEMQQAMKRKNCAVTWVQLVIDQHGLLVFLRVANPLHLGDVKTASKVILRCLPDKQRLAAERSQNWRLKDFFEWHNWRQVHSFLLF